MNYIFRVCRNGNVNDIYVPSGKIVSRMMETFEKEGYKWANYVDGNTDMVYTIERGTNG